MSEEKVITGGSDTNPGSGKPADPTPSAQAASQTAPQVNSQPNIDSQIKALTEKLDRLSNQYDGSTKEALRLKEENDKLKASIETLKKPDNSVNEKEFQKLVEDKGLVGAIDQIFGAKVSSLEQRVEKLVDKESKKIYNDFVSTHPALKEATINQKFEAELTKLRGVYDDPIEAMEKAYTLAGGNAEVKPNPTTSKTEEVKQNEQKVVNSVIGGEQDNKPAPVTQAVDPAKKISDMRAKAANLELQGKTRQAAELYAQIEDLKSSISAKV